jgi:hypothetical protein
VLGSRLVSTVTGQILWEFLGSCSRSRAPIFIFHFFLWISHSVSLSVGNFLGSGLGPSLGRAQFPAPAKATTAHFISWFLPPPISSGAVDSRSRARQSAGSRSDFLFGARSRSARYISVLLDFFMSVLAGHQFRPRILLSAFVSAPRRSLSSVRA